MTAQINAYLTFNGNCRDAMLFYRKCLGGHLTFQTIADSPLSKDLPLKMKNYILEATLKNDTMVLMGTDLADNIGLIKGNTVSLFLHCKDLNQIKGYFNKLAEEGHINHPLETNYWNILFGCLTDKFGNRWLLSYNEQ